ncbi:MAG: hypothetical protein ACR2N7_02905, partial [Acidimicrobiia bacterium]
MGLFKKKTPKVIRKSEATEDRQVRTVNGQQVTVRKFSKAEPKTATATAQKKRPQQRKGGQKKDTRTKSGRSSQRRRPPIEIVEPPETARKQMLVRRSPHQTQIVVLEGPVLVEHYVARSDRQSLVGNVYVGKVRNVLPGMEAAFVDFGEGKNGVLYAGDIEYKSFNLNGKPRRIENVL